MTVLVSDVPAFYPACSRLWSPHRQRFTPRLPLIPDPSPRSEGRREDDLEAAECLAPVHWERKKRSEWGTWEEGLPGDEAV
jgi:hypothetical protein